MDAQVLVDAAVAEVNSSERQSSLELSDQLAMLSARKAEVSVTLELQADLAHLTSEFELLRKVRCMRIVFSYASVRTFFK